MHEMTSDTLSEMVSQEDATFVQISHMVKATLGPGWMIAMASDGLDLKGRMIIIHHPKTPCSFHYIHSLKYLYAVKRGERVGVYSNLKKALLAIVRRAIASDRLFFFVLCDEYTEGLPPLLFERPFARALKRMYGSRAYAYKEHVAESLS